MNSPNDEKQKDQSLAIQICVRCVTAIVETSRRIISWYLRLNLGNKIAFLGLLFAVGPLLFGGVVRLLPDRNFDLDESLPRASDNVLNQISTGMTLRFAESLIGVAARDYGNGMTIHRTQDAILTIESDDDGRIESVELRPTNARTMDRFILDGVWCGTEKRFGDAVVGDFAFGMISSDDVHANGGGSGACTSYFSVGDERPNACGFSKVEVGYRRHCPDAIAIPSSKDYPYIDFLQLSFVLHGDNLRNKEPDPERAYEIMSNARINYLRLWTYFYEPLNFDEYWNSLPLEEKCASPDRFFQESEYERPADCDFLDQ